MHISVATTLTPSNPVIDRLQTFACYSCSHPVLLVLLLLVFSACAIQEPVTDKITAPRWEDRLNELEQIQSWQLSGRIAIRFDRESGSASIHWQQTGDDFHIRIIGPLGKGTLELEGSRAGVFMRDADNQIRRADTAEILLLEYLGWQVPLKGLVHWIKGVPDPAEKVMNMILDEQSRISELVQDDWHISIKAYQPLQNLQLPAKLELSNQNLKVKLVVKKWELLQ